MQLLIVTDGGTSCTVSERECPALHEAFAEWRKAPLRSGREAAAWMRVIEVAHEYMTEDDNSGQYAADGDFVDSVTVVGTGVGK